MDRRTFLKAAGVAATCSWLGPTRAAFGAGTRVIIVGGGFGGATCANFLRRYAPGLDVTLITAREQFVTCPFSNTVLAGINDLSFITQSYDPLRGRGCRVVHDVAAQIEPDKHTVRLESGNSLAYDRLVVAPGIGFTWGSIEGHDEAATQAVPHAWIAGEQTLLLRRQLEAMPDGGVVIISLPREPFRAPPAPYERASLIAYFLQKGKPRSKVLIIDPNESFHKQELFEDGWADLYPGMIERVHAEVRRLDVAGLTLHTTEGIHKADVINLIPPQGAGEVARGADLADQSGWCPVSPSSFESVRHKDVYVIGDAAIAGDMPKSGFAANAQGKTCAAAVIASLNGAPIPESIFTCGFYSLLSPKYAVSEAGVFRVVNGRITEVSGGLSDPQAPKRVRRIEADYALGWYKSITAETFGT